jgi:lysophospholipase L1-like esterase
MILHNVELHNIEEVTKNWNGSYKLQRVPEKVRRELNPGAQERSLYTRNAEIRFTADSPDVRIKLSVPCNDFFQVYHGPFLDPRKFPAGPGGVTVEIDHPEHLRNLKPENKPAGGFDPAVFRVLLPNQMVSFFHVEGDNVRPPDPGQVPGKRYLAYGTSITEGGCASVSYLSYIALTARFLGYDLINLGMSGSCQAEKAMADYIAARKDWDIATLALSVNMREFETEEFRERITYMVNTVAGADTTRPVFCITLYPYFVGLCGGFSREEEEKSEFFRQILRDAVRNSSCPNLRLIEGPDLLDQIDGLSADMIHPSDYGMMRMAQNLTDRINRIIGAAS